MERYQEEYKEKTRKKTCRMVVGWILLLVSHSGFDIMKGSLKCYVLYH